MEKKIEKRGGVRNRGVESVKLDLVRDSVHSVPFRTFFCVCVCVSLSLSRPDEGGRLTRERL